MQAFQAIFVANVNVQLACAGVYNLPAVIEQSLNSYWKMRMIVGGMIAV